MAQTVLGANLAEFPIFPDQQPFVGADPELAVLGGQDAMNLVRRDAVLHGEVLESLEEGEGEIRCRRCGALESVGQRDQGD